MKIVYEYGFMFVIHTSGHVDTYNKDTIEAQKIAQEQAVIDAARDIKTLADHLNQMSKTEPIVKTESVIKKFIISLLRR